MKESYFAKYKGDNGISIARSHPDCFKGAFYPPLFPTWEMISIAKTGDTEKYTKMYNEQILGRLSPKKVFNDLHALVKGEPVLLCWEKDGEFCHRHLVIDWFVDMKNEKELKDILGYGIGSMDDFGELKEAWFSIDKVEEADS